jgi:cell division protein FtsI/penicillin-binding protein 2
MDTSLSRRRMWLLSWAFAAGFAAIAGRLVFIQAIAPVEPQLAAESTARTFPRPAKRGAVLDAKRQPMVMSDLVVTVRADPVKLGIFGGEVAELIAPLVSLPAPVVAERMGPSYYASRESRVTTNGGVLITNWFAVQKVRRNNGITTNLTYSKWLELEERLRKHRFAEEVALLTARTNAEQSYRRTVKQAGWWNLPAYFHAKKERSATLRQINPRLSYLRTNSLESRLNGLYPEIVEVRVYPNSHLAAHVLGYTTNGIVTNRMQRHLPPPLLGAQGIEQRFDAELRGSHGVLVTHKFGDEELVPLRARDVPPVDGLNIRLTIDLNIQSFVEHALDEAYAALQPKSISAVVISPRTGDVLALGNRPTYNPNLGSIPSLEAMLNRALKVPAEPGSTFKIVTYAAALNEGLIQPEERIDCELGHWNVSGTRRRINDDQGHSMDVVTVREAFAKSSNVGAVKIGLRMNTNTFLRYMRDFGFLARTGIECGEFTASTNFSRGQLHIRRAYGESPGGLGGWDGLTSSSLPFGYGFYATPLQTVMAAAAIANDGVLMRPRIVSALERGDGDVVTKIDPVQVRRVIRPESAAQMVAIMRAAVEEGTGGRAAMEEYAVAGKTGTAKKVVDRKYSSTHYYASFVGFLPAENPELVIMVNADEPTTKGKSYYGGKACAPVFHQIATATASYLGLRPSLVSTNGVVLNLAYPALSPH